MSESVPTDEQKVMFGTLSAIQVALRAIVKTHPNPQTLIQAFREEHEETMSLLSLNMPASVPAMSFEAYRDFLKGIAPNPDGWLEQSKPLSYRKELFV